MVTANIATTQFSFHFEYIVRIFRTAIDLSPNHYQHKTFCSKKPSNCKFINTRLAFDGYHKFPTIHSQNITIPMIF